MQATTDRGWRKHGVWAAGALALLAGSPAAAAELAADAAGAATDLDRLSLEELAELKVTSVAKREEALSEAPAAVYVITNDAIRRSGATSLPEALRLAPNLEISRVDALDYSITARGFGGFESSEKLLVLVDGRSVWTPLYGGVDWDQQHLLLDDVQQIEVTSGPGGTLWGANAFNGVINVSTKSALDTVGVLATADVGSLDSTVAGRLGFAAGDDGAARIYIMGAQRGGLRTPAGAKVGDSWDTLQGGFRFDWAGANDGLTLQGDAHNGTLDNSLGLGGYVRGQNVLGRWTHNSDAFGDLQAQAYYDHFGREARLIHDELTTWDIQVQDSVQMGRHRLVWGGGYRWMSDQVRTLFEPQLLSPPHRKTTIGNAFAQDEVALRPDLALTLGLKLEANSYTRAEWLPNARLAWRLDPGQLVWAAVSRAIRDPSRIERDFQIPGVTIPGIMNAETLIAYEAGYRGRIGARANLSVSLFYNAYDDLRTNDLTAPSTYPGYVGNSMKGRTYGVEAWSDLDVTSFWRVSVGGALLGRDFHLKPGSLDVSAFKAAGADPGHWVKIRSTTDLGHGVSLDVALRAVGRIPDAPSADLLGVAAYTEADARLSWRVRDGLELSVRGDNLLHRRHLESVDARREAIPRSVSVGLRWTPQ